MTHTVLRLRCLFPVRNSPQDRGRLLRRRPHFRDVPVPCCSAKPDRQSSASSTRLDRAPPRPRRNPELIAPPPTGTARPAYLRHRLAATKTSTTTTCLCERPASWQTATTTTPGPDDAPQLASPPTLCRLENRVPAEPGAAGGHGRRSGRAVHRRAPHAARGVGAGLRRHRRPGPRSPGEPLLPRLLRRLLLFAAVRDVWRPSASGLPPACRRRPGPTHPRHPQTAGRQAPAGLAGRALVGAGETAAFAVGG